HEGRAKTLDRFARPCEDASDAFGGAPSSGGMMVWMPRVVAVYGRSAAERGLAGNCAEHQLLRVGCWVQWIAHNSPSSRQLSIAKADVDCCSSHAQLILFRVQSFFAIACSPGSPAFSHRNDDSSCPAEYSQKLSSIV